MAYSSVFLKQEVGQIDALYTLHMALCPQLDTHRSEVIRASLEMALPVFKNHPDLYDYFRQRSRQGW